MIALQFLRSGDDRPLISNYLDSQYLPFVKHGIGEVADSRVGCRERLDSDRGCHSIIGRSLQHAEKLCPIARYGKG